MTDENQNTEPVEASSSDAAPSVSADTPVSEADIWENALNAVSEASNNSVANDVSETEAKDPAAPFPSPDADKDAIPAVENTSANSPKAPEGQEPDEEPDEEGPDEEAVIQAKGDPLSLSRKQLREIEKSVLIPLRNPDVPIKDVIDALYQFHPTRVEAIFQEILNESALKMPDAWLQELTGIEGLTVAEVQALKEAGRNAPLTEQKSADKSIEDYLTEVYGEDWKDAANDEYLLEEDKMAVKAAREVLKYKALAENAPLEYQAKLDNALKDVEEVREKARQFEEHQKAVFESARSDIFASAVQDYRTAVESRVIPKFFNDIGVAASDSDTDIVRDAKEFVRGLFEDGSDGEGSYFSGFLANEFSESESWKKHVDRVGKYLNEAAEKEAKAKVSPSPQLLRDAQGLRKQAELERDSIAVLTKKAAKEFAATPRASFAMKAIEIIADLERQISRGGRRETLGNTVTTTDPDAWKSDPSFVQDPWGDALQKRFAEIVAR